MKTLDLKNINATELSNNEIENIEGGFLPAILIAAGTIALAYARRQAVKEAGKRVGRYVGSRC